MILKIRDNSNVNNFGVCWLKNLIKNLHQE